MMMRALFPALMAIAAWATIGSATLQAQSVSDVLAFLITNQSVETGSVERDLAAAQATSDTISRSVLASLATLPVAASSGGFIYRLNPALGTVERATRNFGPFFIERALTTGGHRASFGITFQHMRFTSLDGHPLREGTLVTTANIFIDESEPFDVDRLTLAIDADVATVYANVGITDRLEIGVAAPMVSLRLDGSRVNVYRDRTFTQATASSTAIGLADIVLRTKATVVDLDDGGLAVAFEARLPTGRREDLLGTGERSWKVAGIGTIERGAVATHGNVSTTFGGFEREIGYGGAVALAASSRLTISGEFLGRWMDGIGHIRSVIAPHPTLGDVDTIRLVSDVAGRHMVNLAPGFKWNLTETWVLVGAVTVPLTDSGLTSSITPFIGFDYSMGR